MKNSIAKMGAVLLTIGAALTLSGCGEDSGTNADNRNGSNFGAGEKMVDPRDGQTYKIITIGTQIWMAENLNYQTAGSMCYDNNPDYCQKYGRLYNWHDAMNACPSGWHLPSKEEFETLLYSVGGDDIAGTALKSRSGWNDFEGKSGNGTDAFDFGALPAGSYLSYSDYFFGEGNYAIFWSSSEIISNAAYRLNLYYDGENAGVDNGDKNIAFSVRCVKNTEGLGGACEFCRV